MSDEHQKATRELRVFAEFAIKCPLGIQPNTAQKRQPPEPDILADLESGERAAFELVRCEDVSRERLGHKGPGTIIPGRTIEKMALAECLRLAYNEAAIAGTVEKPERFRGRSIRVYFEDGLPNKNRREKAAKRVIKLLNEQGPGRYTTKYGKIRLQCEPYPIPSPIEGPCFYVSSGCGARQQIVERIQEKIGKKYSTEHELHLIAWSTTATRSEFEGLHKDVELTNLLQSRGMGPFQRIWVFGYSAKTILFDSSPVV